MHSESRFSYRSVIGKLNYLAQCSLPNIVYVLHQCVWFWNIMCLVHKRAVRLITNYLASTSTCVTESNKFTPKLKSIAIKYHHFQSFVHKKIILIWYIDTQEQKAEIFITPLDEALFIYIQRKLSWWWLQNESFASTRYSLRI